MLVFPSLLTGDKFLLYSAKDKVRTLDQEMQDLRPDFPLNMYTLKGTNRSSSGHKHLQQQVEEHRDGDIYGSVYLGSLQELLTMPFSSV